MRRFYIHYIFFVVIIAEGIETFKNMKGIEIVQNMRKMDFSQQFQIEMQERLMKVRGSQSQLLSLNDI